jgi:hypothetical protein
MYSTVQTAQWLAKECKTGVHFSTEPGIVCLFVTPTPNERVITRRSGLSTHWIESRMGPKTRLDSLEKKKIAFTEIIGHYSESRRCEVHALSEKKCRNTYSYNCGLDGKDNLWRGNLYGELAWKCCAQIRRFIWSCHAARPPPKRRDKKQLKHSQLSNSVNGMTHEPTQSVSFSLTRFVDQSPSRETDSHLLWHQKVHCHIHNSPSLYFVTSYCSVVGYRHIPDAGTLLFFPINNPVLLWYNWLYVWLLCVATRTLYKMKTAVRPVTDSSSHGGCVHAVF